MIQVLRPQGQLPGTATARGMTFHGQVIYPPGRWGRRRPVFPATIEVHRGSHVLPLWDTAETDINGSFSTTKPLAIGTPDVFLKIRDAITTDRFEIDLGPSAAPISNRPRLPLIAVIDPSKPAEIIVPWKPQNLPKLGCVDGRYYSDIHDFARALCAKLRARALPTTVSSMWLAADGNDARHSRAEVVLRRLARTGLPAAFPDRLAKAAGLRTYTEGMAETAIAVLGRIAALGTNQVEDSMLLRPLLNGVAAALETFVDWDTRSPWSLFADTAAVCVLHYVAGLMAKGGKKVSVRIGAYDPGFPPAWHFRTVAFSVGH